MEYIGSRKTHIGRSLSVPFYKLLLKKGEGTVMWSIGSRKTHIGRYYFLLKKGEGSVMWSI